MVCDSVERRLLRTGPASRRTRGLEAQRLGLEAHASDLNPVAVLINKAMIEIPPRFAGRSPVNPEFRGLHAEGMEVDPKAAKRRRGQSRIGGEQWRGAQGLAEDVRYYGRWMRDEAEKRIGHLYPKIEITPEMARQRPDLKPYEDRKLTVIAWLWARTVRSPNPAFGDVEVPLVSTWMLSTKKAKEAYIEPVIEGRGYRFRVRAGAPQDLAAAKRGTKLPTKATFRCLMSDSPIPNDYIKAEGQARRIGQRLLAVVAEGDRSRVYVAPEQDHEVASRVAAPSWRPELNMPKDRRWFSPPLYGFPAYGDIFTPRQLVALTTFSDLVGEAMERLRVDAEAASLPDDGRPLRDGGTGATAYAEAVGLYLAFGISRLADAQNSLCQWGPSANQTQHLFRRQAIPMVWDYAESSVFSGAAGDLTTSLESMCRVLDRLTSAIVGSATTAAAQSQSVVVSPIVSFDPPYYDNIGYADLSDFFYVWLRRCLTSIFPGAFATLAVPKTEELIASPYRHGTKKAAELFFLDGMTRAMARLSRQAHSGFPVTIYYAFKQSERNGNTGTASTGWETFLGAVIRSGFAITGTWPVRTERGARSIGIGTNALASSIVLVCRPRSADAPLATRREFLAALRAELPQALRLLQTGNIAPVDLAQAAIGPGMRIYTRSAKVVHASGEEMTVREALALINDVLDEVLEEQESDLDSESRWALAWFDEHGFDRGEFGHAEILSTAKNTTIEGMKEARIVGSAAGRVWLLRPGKPNRDQGSSSVNGTLLPEAWDPRSDPRPPVWKAVHHLVRVLDAGGEAAAAELLRKLGSGMAERARDLCYRLYVLCERKKRANEARAYNGLVRSWPELKRLASRKPEPQQTHLNAS